MTLTAVYGTYNAKTEEEDLFSFKLSLPKSNLLEDWKQCIYAANTVSSNYSKRFPNNKKSANIISYIINELIENAVKYSDEDKIPIHLKCTSYSDRVELETINLTNFDFAKKFDIYLKKTLYDDLEKIFYKHLLTAANGNNQQSGMGLLIIRKDYKANVGFKILPRENVNNEFDIHVKIGLNYEEVDAL